MLCFDTRISTNPPLRRTVLGGAVCLVALLVAPSPASAQEPPPYEPIDSDACITCHEESSHGTPFVEDLSHSTHNGLECLACHSDKETTPHREDSGFTVGCDGCRSCHEDAGAAYRTHGRARACESDDTPQCQDCHGDHDILPSDAKRSKTHPVNLPATCGACHENLDVTTRYAALIDHPIEIYESSVHGKTTGGGVHVAATCSDCHSTDKTAHEILAPGDPRSTINHFNIPRTCGKCHQGIESDFDEGIHGQLVARGETDAPVCTHCHGEHGIISPDDPRSPVSRARVAEATCSPCHESTLLNEKYGVLSRSGTSFIDSYHGLKSKAGDTHVANCASCHGVHRILPSSDPDSTIHPSNLQTTCGECHPGISEKIAAKPIHGVSGQRLRGTAADIVAKIYIVAIVVIIGLMVLHWLVDLFAQLRALMTARPQVRRMTLNEIWQHLFLMITFVTLVISGFALRFSDGWMSRLFFGWEGGFELRGDIHRLAAGVFMFTVVWHVIFIVFRGRGRTFVRDMIPTRRDVFQFGRRILHNLGRRRKAPSFGRFSYVEKAEYWALVWGSAIMILTGVVLWFDNWFIQFLPKSLMDVVLVVHYYEAWLATLAILVWHLYATVFSPHVYPMNPSWLTGKMPETMYRQEHPEHVVEAKRETEEHLRAELERLSAAEADEASEI